jgi:hypothetical protein
LARETEVLAENLPQCRFVHHAARTRTRAAAMGSQRLTAELRHGLEQNSLKFVSAVHLFVNVVCRPVAKFFFFFAFEIPFSYNHCHFTFLGFDVGAGFTWKL